MNHPYSMNGSRSNEVSDLLKPCAVKIARTVSRGGSGSNVVSLTRLFCESKEDAEQAARILAEWLKQRGLQLSREKTCIVHLSEGFDFLGFNIRHYKAPRTSSSGWKLLIKPSHESAQKIRNKLRHKWLSLRGANVVAVLTALNPIIRGWANYFRCGVAAEIFKKLDHSSTAR